MAYPITDKGTTVELSPNGHHVRLEKRLTKQAKPYSLPADYRKATRKVTGTGVFADPPVGSGANANDGFAPWYVAVPMAFYSYDTAIEPTLRQARERFVGRVQEKANWAVNLAERHQAISMMTQRLTQVYQLCRHLRRGDLRGAAGVIGFKDLASVRNASRSFAKNFLEWHFGWSPLIQDIYTSAEILSQDFKPKKVSGSARSVVLAVGQGLSPGQWGNKGEQKYTVKCRVAGSYRVTNPNLRLASQMGLTNPATVAWELVPFSFVVDWFINIGDFLAQWDEFVGISLEEPYHSWRVSGSGFYSFWSDYPGHVGEVSGTITSSLEQFDRARGLPTISLAFNRGEILSVSRAVTACALLIQKGIRGG